MIVNKVQVDNAKLRKGGIDFNPEHLKIQSQGKKVEIPLPNNLQEYHNIEIHGLVPFIFSVTPVTNLPLLLGEIEGPVDQEDKRLSSI